MWNAPVLIFEGEDEAALIGRFVHFRALYPQHSPFEIARHIFKDLRDPEARSQQAAMVWERDLEIAERVRSVRLNGVEPKELSKEELQAKLLTLTENTGIPYQDKKVMIEGYISIARLNGWEQRQGGMELNADNDVEFLKELAAGLPS